MSIREALEKAGVVNNNDIDDAIIAESKSIKQEEKDMTEEVKIEEYDNDSNLLSINSLINELGPEQIYNAIQDLFGTSTFSEMETGNHVVRNNYRVPMLEHITAGERKPKVLPIPLTNKAFQFVL